MVATSLKHSVLFFLLFPFSMVMGQQATLSSLVSLNKTSVFVGEPVEVTISINTSTWFTSGVDIGNIKVNGAFSVYFRSVSTSREVNGKSYPGVNFIYNVFPFEAKDVTIPPLTVEVETPDESDFKGKKRTLTTRSRTIKVKPIPLEMQDSPWLVANGMNLYENWSGNLDKVKVGDVLGRKITRVAFNTVGELIPPLVWDTIPGLSIYPQRSGLENNKTKTSISATRTDNVSYLFEKEGEVVIPELTLTWWNPYRQRLYKRTLKERTIDVQPNPDLGMLTSIRDSMNALQATIAEGEEAPKKLTFLGMSLKQFLLALVLAFGLGILLYKFFREVHAIYLEERHKYLASEHHFFRQYLHAARKGHKVTATNALYHWLDRLDLDEPTIESFLQEAGNGNKEPGVMDTTAWKGLRKRYFTPTQIETGLSLNP